MLGQYLCSSGCCCCVACERAKLRVRVREQSSPNLGGRTDDVLRRRFLSLLLTSFVEARPIFVLEPLLLFDAVFVEDGVRCERSRAYRERGAVGAADAGGAGASASAGGRRDQPELPGPKSRRARLQGRASR